jgi:hypothetical protein
MRKQTEKKGGKRAVDSRSTVIRRGGARHVECPKATCYLIRTKCNCRVCGMCEHACCVTSRCSLRSRYPWYTYGAPSRPTLCGHAHEWGHQGHLVDFVIGVLLRLRRCCILV